MSQFKPDWHAISKMVQHSYSTMKLDLHFVFEHSEQIPQMVLVLRYMYALKPKTAMKLASVSRETPFLPLDDIFVTGNQ